MENFIFISPDFPKNYENFCVALKRVGFNVLAIGGTPYHELTQTLKDNVTEYYYCPDLGDYDSVYKATAYYIYKYGRISFLESNNEHWLVSDARLRADFNIEGLKPDELVYIKHKSKMKERYRIAGVKYASYALVNTHADFDDFLEDFGYPLFIKPDVGVGANDSYKIANEEEKFEFFKNKKNLTYIVEPFIDGVITSFDAIVDLNGEVVFATSHVFPVANEQIAQGNSDDYYYSPLAVEEPLFTVGQAVVKAFNIKGRNVHLEFFKLTHDTTFAKAGEYIGLEVNMRSPGGYIPDMISLACKVDYYDIYARMMKGLAIGEQNIDKRSIGLEVSRRKEYLSEYFYTNEEIESMFASVIVDKGLYPEILARGMGDYYFVGLFEDLNTALAFKSEVLRRKL